MQSATVSPSSPNKKVMVEGPMEAMLRQTHPWVREYFHGPRARAASAG